MPVGEQELNTLAARVAELIIKAKRLVIFTGAGVSTESGIPDFRSPGGIWDRFDPEDFTYQKFLRDVSARKRLWQLLHALAATAEPNPAHYAIAELYRLGRLGCVITQNVDNLHQRAGVPDDKVLELHGNSQWVVCLSCSQRYPFEQVKLKLNVGEEAPDCPACHGILKPAAVLFGEPLPERVLKEATRRSNDCDLFIVIGSALAVYPAADMPAYAVSSGANLVIINLSPTPMDRQASLLVRAKAGEAMPRIVERVKVK